MIPGPGAPGRRDASMVGPSGSNSVSPRVFKVDPKATFMGDPGIPRSSNEAKIKAKGVVRRTHKVVRVEGPLKKWKCVHM